jgi:hypothetical protein
MAKEIVLTSLKLKWIYHSLESNKSHINEAFVYAMLEIWHEQLLTLEVCSQKIIFFGELKTTLANQDIM